MNEEEKQNTDAQQAEPARPSISIGGVAPVNYDADPLEEEGVVNTPGIVRQTMVIGLNDKKKQEEEKQIEVIGPEIKEENKVTQKYMSASQETLSGIKKQSTKRALIIALVSVLLLAAIGLFAYFVLV